MAAINIPADFVELTINWANISQLGSNPASVFGWKPASTADFGDMRTVAEGSIDQLMPVICSAWSTTGYTIRIGAGGGPPYVSFDTPYVATGERVDNCVPPNIALLVAKVTSTPGRSGRGRFFMPGAPEDQLDDGGNWTTGYLDDASTAMADFATTLAIGDGDGMFILHKEGSLLADTPSEVLAFLPVTVAAQQHRRLRS